MKLLWSLLTLNALLIASPLYDAIDIKDYKTVSNLLKNGADPYEYHKYPDNYKDANPYHTICYVSTFSDTKMLAVFLPHLTSIDKICPTLGNTPLMSAAGAGNIENVKFLLSKGANINAIKKSSYHSNVLMYAIQANQTDMAKLLIDKGADVNYMGTYNFTSLSVAVTKDNFEMIKYLIEHGANIKALPGLAALKYAVTPLKYETVKLLIKHGVNLSYKDKNGNTILHLLASGIVDKNIHGLKNMLEHPRKGYPKSYYEMIQKQVDSLDNRWENYPKIIQYIVAHGGNPHLKNNEGKTAFEVAKENHTKIFLQTIRQ